MPSPLTIIAHISKAIDAAEKLSRDEFQAEHVQLDSGRELLLVAITGENLDGLAMVMEGLHMGRLEAERVKLEPNEYPHGSTLKLHYRGDPDCIGWAHRGPGGSMLSAYSKHPLDPDMWVVIAEKGV
ncbi:hypothetical protein ACOQNP_17965 [Ectopseudomonas khazarica]